MEATLIVKDQGAFSSDPFPVMPTSDLQVVDRYGAKHVTFELSNSLSEPIQSPHLSIACYNASKQIIGGGFDFPEMVPASRTVKVETPVNLSGDPESCTVFTGAPVDWKAPSTDTNSTANQETSGATKAFQLWIEQFDAKDWSAQYSTLVTPQQGLITQAEYVACRAKEATPGVKWIKLVGTEEGVENLIPGTNVTMSATKVTAQVEFNGIALPIDSHMYNEVGQWKWAMTSENLAGCGK